MSPLLVAQSSVYPHGLLWRWNANGLILRSSTIFMGVPSTDAIKMIDLKNIYIYIYIYRRPLTFDRYVYYKRKFSKNKELIQ